MPFSIFSVKKAVDGPQEVHSCTSKSQFSWKEGRKENKSNLLGLGRGKLQSAVYIISLVTCSGLERRNGDLSGNISWKQGDSYRIFQILKQLKP